MAELGGRRARGVQAGSLALPDEECRPLMGKKKLRVRRPPHGCLRTTRGRHSMSDFNPEPLASLPAQSNYYYLPGNAELNRPGIPGDSKL